MAKFTSKDEQDTKKSKNKNKNRTKKWVEVTDQPEKTKGGTYLGSASFIWADDADKERHNMNIVFPNPFKMRVTGSDLMITPKGGEAFKYGDEKKEEEKEEEEKGTEEGNDEEQGGETAPEDTEEEAPPKKKKKKVPEPQEEEEAPPTPAGPPDPEEEEINKAEAELNKRKEALRLRKEIEAEEADLARRQEALAEKKRKHAVVRAEISTKVEKDIKVAGPEKVGESLGKAVLRMSKNSAVSSMRIANFILKSLVPATRKTVWPFMKKAMEVSKKAVVPTAQAAKRAIEGLRTLPPRPAALAASMNSTFSTPERMTALVLDAAADASTTEDQASFLSAGTPTTDFVLPIAALYNDQVQKALEVVLGDKLALFVENDGVFAVYCEMAGHGDGIDTLELSGLPLDSIRDVLPSLTDATALLDDSINAAAAAYTSAMYTELAEDLNIAVEQSTARPLDLRVVAVPSEHFDGNAYDALALLRSSLVGSPIAIRTCSSWIGLERAGVVNAE